MRLSPRATHVLVALAAVLMIVVVRWIETGPRDLKDLATFESATGVAIGPESEFFASGLNGDGAAFAIVAVDPLGMTIGRRLFEPSYRYSRFGYPFLAWGLSAGRSDWVLAGLSVAGLVSVGVNGYVASMLNERRGWRAWLLVCNPALVIGALWGTAEPLALGLLTVSLITGSVIAGFLVTVVRPSYLLATVNRPRLFVAGLTLAVVVKAVWSLRFDDSFLSGASNLGLPFVGIWQATTWMGLAVVGSGAVTSAVGIAKRDWAWAVSGFFVVCLSAVVLDNPINALRAAGVLPVLWAFGPGFVLGSRTARPIAPAP